ncbi:protein kinase domain-containing protein [Prosthecobacter sp.]|uniref:protein kinase domain-containing protein n=1 Tax=Prosthecobacter sp. TaxID=1965333 RepID=UPI0037832D98
MPGPSPNLRENPWHPPTVEELQNQLPQYEIIALLGRGGMGAVYKGVQLSLDRQVAIKILSHSLHEADASFAERFKNEARAMGRLKHPGIVGVHDFGLTEGGLLYIVMEFIDGTDVSAMIASQGRLRSEQAMAIAAHVCDALAYAHEQGIIHRDIKPANIMVSRNGLVQVTDFGLAKMTHAGHTGPTQDGATLGTLLYMAPESLMLGIEVDRRADIYGIGVMLYQMLTGTLPQGVFRRPSQAVPGLDPRFDPIITKAMQEDRDLRYPNAMTMRRDLDAILTQPVMKVDATEFRAFSSIETQPLPQRSTVQPRRTASSAAATPPRNKNLPLLGLAFLALIGFAGWVFSTLRPPALPASPPAAPVATSPVPPSPPFPAPSSGATSAYFVFPPRNEPLPSTPARRGAVAAVTALGARVLVKEAAHLKTLEVYGGSQLPSMFIIYEIDAGIDFTKHPLTDNDLALLTVFPDLEILNLSFQEKLSPKSLAGLSNLKRITNFQLNGTQVDDATTTLLAKLPYLNVINFENTKITDQAVENLASRLNYVVLSFTHCPITDASAKVLASFKGLKRLRLRGTLLTPQAVAMLRQTLPDCIIEAE